MIEIIILSLIQGITEFLPISSSSHLVLVSEYLKFENQSLEIDVSLHIGSFLAVVTYFRKDIIQFIKNKDLLFKIILSSLPIILIGYLLVELNLIHQLRDIKLIGWMTIIFGVLLFISDKYKLNKNMKNGFNYKSAIFIGFFQTMSLIPGVSRSGVTITAARLLNFKRYDSAKIAFLLSIPTLGAVSLFGIMNLMNSGNLKFSIINVLSILFSFFISFITIKFFLNYIKNYNLNIFVLYRLILGIIILFFSYL